MSPLDPPDSVDDAIRRLDGAGYTAEIVRLAGREWLVIGSRPGSRLLAHGPTPLEACARVLAQARDLGVLEG